MTSCDDHSSLSSTTAVQYEFHTYFTLSLYADDVDVLNRNDLMSLSWKKRNLHTWFTFGPLTVYLPRGFPLTSKNRLALDRVKSISANWHSWEEKG